MSRFSSLCSDDALCWFPHSGLFKTSREWIGKVTLSILNTLPYKTVIWLVLAHYINKKLYIIKIVQDLTAQDRKSWRSVRRPSFRSGSQQTELHINITLIPTPFLLIVVIAYCTSWSLSTSGSMSTTSKSTGAPTYLKYIFLLKYLTHIQLNCIHMLKLFVYM